MEFLNYFVEFKVPSTSRETRTRQENTNYDESAKQYEFDSEQEVGDYSGGSSDEYEPHPERGVVFGIRSKKLPSSTQKRRPRGIMAHRAKVQQRSWIVDDQPIVNDDQSTVELRGRGRGATIGRGGRKPGSGRGRGRGLRMERLHEHTKIVDSLIEDDVLFPTTEPRVKVARKTAQNLTKGILFYLFRYHQCYMKYSQLIFDS